jgi:hypothetical protein
MRQLADPLVIVRIVIPVHEFREDRDDLFLGEILGGAEQKCPQKQGEIHHGKPSGGVLYVCITILIYALYLPWNQGEIFWQIVENLSACSRR